MSPKKPQAEDPQPFHVRLHHQEEAWSSDPPAQHLFRVTQVRFGSRWRTELVEADIPEPMLRRERLAVRRALSMAIASVKPGKHILVQYNVIAWKDGRP